MNAYTRMRSMSTDFASKPTLSLQPKQSLQLVTPTPTPHRKEEDDDAKPHTHLSWQHKQEEEEEESGLTFGVVLSRSCSSASQRIAKGSSSTLPTAVRRAFSMRRSSSVREGYWRIHDPADEIDEGESKEEKQHQQQVRCSRQKKQGKILRACKRMISMGFRI